VASAGVIRPEDRLFHLTLALMSTSQGLTKDQILSTVRGYREDSEAGLAKASIERRFERDKDLLRELGIPLVAWIPPSEDDNNKATVYRIPKDQYEPPAGFELDAQDIRLLNIAAAVWREGSLSSEARLTHTKLAASGMSVDEPLIGFLPMLTVRDPALDTLRQAIAEQVQVRFDYLTPGQAGSKTRTVSPRAVVLHENRWHLLSVEEPGGAEKTFLVRRIVSEVKPLAEPAREADEGQVARMTQELAELYERHTATLSVKAGSAAETVLANRPGSTREGNQITIHYTDRGALAAELLEFAPEITVLSPAELTQDMVDLLARVEAAHG
jgi:proteasome accessory factor B